MYIEFSMLYMMELDWRSSVMTYLLLELMFGDLGDDLFPRILAPHDQIFSIP